MDNIIKFLISIILVLLIFYFHKKYEKFSLGKCYGMDGKEKIINEDGTCSNYCYCFNGTAVDPETPDNNFCINETKQHCYSCDEEYELRHNLCYDTGGNFEELEDGSEISELDSIAFIPTPVETVQDSTTADTVEDSTTADTVEDSTTTEIVSEEIIKDFIYDSSSTEQFTEHSITFDKRTIADILLVGGGGGGGAFGGGGGGGGVLFKKSIILEPNTYTIKVGKSGNGAPTYNNGVNGSNGYNSAIIINGIEYIANGGGGGGTRNPSPYYGSTGNAGGSGGGGSHANASSSFASSSSFTSSSFSGGSAVGGASTQLSYTGWESYGNIGGYGRNGTQGGAPNHASGGGGGAGYQGENTIQSKHDDRTWPTYGGGGDGGVGKDFTHIFGINYGDNGWFAGGGGGQTYLNAGRVGWGSSYTGVSNNIRGFGGGGDGGFNASPNIEATKGIDGTGGGGGGARTSVAGADGGSGIVLIKYKNYIEESIVENENFINLFTYDESNDINTYDVTFDKDKIVDILLVAGGGGGGQSGGGGGGAGGLIFKRNVEITKGIYNVVVGKGGNPSANGGDSSFNSLIAKGGGHGSNMSSTAGNGGSGGGGQRNHGSNRTSSWHTSYPGKPGGVGIVGQGTSGGEGKNKHGYDSAGGGGGGAREEGESAFNRGRAGRGGIGLSGKDSIDFKTHFDLEIDGTIGEYDETEDAIYFAGGGGGGNSHPNFENSIKNALEAAGVQEADMNIDMTTEGGLGGGGKGEKWSNVGQNALPNTGGGAGGGSCRHGQGKPGGKGGSGVVIIRYRDK